MIKLLSLQKRGKRTFALWEKGKVTDAVMVEFLIWRKKKKRKLFNIRLEGKSHQRRKREKGLFFGSAMKKGFSAA